MKKEKRPEFRSLLESLINEGEREIVAEYDHGELIVYLVRGHSELGVAQYQTEDEKNHADAVLTELEKTKKIRVGGKPYRLTFKITESFGEPCWRIRVKEKT